MLSMTIMAMTSKQMDTADRGASFAHACPSMSAFSHGVWYHSPNAIKQRLLFFHGNALTNVSLACGHQAGKNFVMELET